jgi:hypothetical protein
VALLAAIPASASAAGADESVLLALTNSARAAAGAGPLTLDSGLSDVARRWASSMAANGAISHNTNLRNEIGSGWGKYGENVGYGGAVEVVHDLLLKSPAHYANIVDREFTSVGLGVVRANGLVWLVQVFFTPASSSGAMAPLAAAPVAPVVTAAAPKVTTPPTTAPKPAPTTTSTSTTTTTVSPVPPTTVAAAPTSGLPLQVTLMVQQLRVLGVPG